MFAGLDDGEEIVVVTEDAPLELGGLIEEGKGEDHAHSGESEVDPEEDPQATGDLGGVKSVTIRSLD